MNDNFLITKNTMSIFGGFVAYRVVNLFSKSQFGVFWSSLAMLVQRYVVYGGLDRGSKEEK